MVCKTDELPALHKPILQQVLIIVCKYEARGEGSGVQLVVLVVPTVVWMKKKVGIVSNSLVTN